MRDPIKLNGILRKLIYEYRKDRFTSLLSTVDMIYNEKKQARRKCVKGKNIKLWDLCETYVVQDH